MSSSSDDQSTDTTSPASDNGALSNTTATSGFTAVNGRRSPSESAAQGNGINGHLKMESAVGASSHGLESSRPAGPPQRAHTPEDTSSHSTMGSPGKRKRVDSDGREHLVEQGVYPPTDKRRTPPQTWNEVPPQGMQRAANHQPSYPAPDADPKDTHVWYANRQQRAETPSSEARLAEALQRENSQNTDARHRAQSDPSVEPIGGTPQHMITSTTETTAAGVLVDPKKRKRIFSNRTKTGCQTCRKRKKKCDEAKPECLNCTRGGFVCEGYTNKSQWQKPLNARSTPIALQSKEMYENTGGLMPRFVSHVSRLSDAEGSPRPPRDGYHLGGQTQMHSDGQRAHPIVVDEEQTRSSWGNSGWTEAQTPSREYMPQRTSGMGFQTGTPLPDPNRQQGGYEARLNAQDRHMGMTAHGQTLLQHVENMPNEMAKRNEELSTLPQLRNHGPQSTMASTAALALQHSQHMSSSSPVPQPGLPQPMRNGRPLSEKEKMLSQQPHMPYADQLISDREACSSAVGRFNNSVNPLNGSSREERLRLFRQILEPHTGDPRRSVNPATAGRVGHGVIVEAPFTCSYGYNVKIGNNTCIGRGCTIYDSALVSIGERCTIGPNVDIYAVESVDEPGVEQGSKRLEVGKQVEIEDGVIIEGRCIIKSGVRIRTGSKILAGTIVDKNVPAHVIFGPVSGDVLSGKWNR